MNRFFRYLIALLLPSMVSCTGGKVKDVPEDMYGCPMPDSVYEDGPEVYPDVPENENS